MLGKIVQPIAYGHHIIAGQAFMRRTQMLIIIGLTTMEGCQRRDDYSLRDDETFQIHRTWKRAFKHMASLFLVLS